MCIECWLRMNSIGVGYGVVWDFWYLWEVRVEFREVGFIVKLCLGLGFVEVEALF